MKTFLEDLGRKIGETAEIVTNKAGEAVEIQRLRNQIRALERGNEDDYMNLGRTVYEDFKAGEITDLEVVGICEAIQNREESIEQCGQQIRVVRGDSSCEQCGKSVANEMAFCPYCGTRVPEENHGEKTDYAEEVKETVADMAEKVKEKAENVAEYVYEKAEAAAEKVEKAVKDTVENAETTAEKTKETAEETVEELKKKMEETVNSTTED